MYYSRLRHLAAENTQIKFSNEMLRLFIGYNIPHLQHSLTVVLIHSQLPTNYKSLFTMNLITESDSSNGTLLETIYATRACLSQ